MSTESAVRPLQAAAIEAPEAAGEGTIYGPERVAEHRALMDRILEEGGRRIRRSVERAVAMGIVDDEGNRLKKDLPADMIPGADRDFGG